MISKKTLNNSVYFLFWLAAIFFPILQSFGLKWQYTSVFLVLLLFTQPIEKKIYFHELIIFSFSFLSLIFFLFFEISLYFNIFIGFLISLVVSRSNANEVQIIPFVFFILITYLFINNLIPLFDYTKQFTALNQFYGVNRICFIFFIFYFFFINSWARYFISFFIIILTARFIIFSVIVIELLKSPKYAIYFVLFFFCVIFLVYEEWMLDYYLFNISDKSSEIRITRYFDYLSKIVNNSFFPLSSYKEAPHNFLLEFLMYYGLFGFVFLIWIFYHSSNKIYFITISIALLSPKTMHDILAFYLFFGFVIKYYLKKFVILT